MTASMPPMPSTTPPVPLAPLYLSRLVLNAQRRDVQYDLSNCHFVHRRLLMAFPDQPNHDEAPFAAREHYGLLYRVERERSGVQVLVQSNVLPDWAKFPEGYLSEPAVSKRIDTLYALLRTGMELGFCLSANPTRRLSDRSSSSDARWRGKRVDLRREEDQIAWLFRKGEEAGFHPLVVRRHQGSMNIMPGAADAEEAASPVAAVRLDAHAAVTGKRRDTGALAFGAVTFIGRLRVTDADRFRLAVVKGIGSGKAYGFGLLSIAR